MDGWIDGWTDRQTNKQTDKQTDKQIDRTRCMCTIRVCVAALISTFNTI